MRKAQAILGVTVVFIIGLLLFFGIIGMWMWGDNQIAKRQPEYNQSRVDAGTLKKSFSSAKSSDLLVKAIAQRDDLEAQLASMRSSIGDSIAELEASLVPFETPLNQYKAEKVLLDAEKAALETEQANLETELAGLLKTCSMWCGDWCDPCVDRIDWIQVRLGDITTRIAEIDDRVNNFLIPEINRLQEIVDQINAAMAILEDDVKPGEKLEEQIRELEEFIAELESAESDPEDKDLYWPVYDPDELTEEDVFGAQE